MVARPAALTRRCVLATLPGVVISPLAAGTPRAMPSKPVGLPASGKTLPEPIDRLAMQLANALCAVEDGRCLATVYPATYADPPVFLTEIAADAAAAESSVAGISVAEPAAKTAHNGAAGNVSQALGDAICDHCVAYAELGRIAHETDAVVLGREPTSREWRRLERASDRERDLLTRLCAAPVGTDAERHAKASYLLALFDGDEPSGEHVAAILRSMMCETVS
ncbi:hypothetical protein ATER59S_01698 [Aquamicrobium terrae]